MNIREYEIIEQIGEQGGMGTVYKVRHKTLGIIRAIKKLHIKLAQDDTIITRFENEAKTLALLDHPNIVKIHDFFSENDTYYLVMEHISGSTLKKRISDFPLDEQTAIKYFMQVLSTIKFAHNKKILHRDIKPSNILIDDNDIVRVVDFGIAKIMDTEGPTRIGTSMGSPWYMAPEQITGQKVDERTEIYTLGINLFEMLTGEVPFNDTSEYNIYEKHKKEKIPSLKKYIKNFSSKLDAIIRKATAKKPAKRYQNVPEFAEAIEMYQALCDLGDKTVPGVHSTGNKDDEVELTGNNQVDSKLVSIDTGQKYVETIVQSRDDSHQKEIPPLSAESGIRVFIDKYKIPIVYFMLSLFMFVAGICFIWNWIIDDDIQENLVFWIESVDSISVEIEWFKIPGISYYSIDRKVIKSPRFSNLPNVKTTFFNDTGLIPNTGYTYRITAFDKYDKEVDQNEIKFFTNPLHKTDPIIVPTKKPIAKSRAKSNKKSPVKEKLKFFGELSVFSNPEKAEVYLNNKQIGTTPLIRDSMLVGTHQLTLKKEGYADTTFQAKIKNGELIEKHISLNKEFGVIKVLVIPYGSIYIDGKLEEKETEVQWSEKFQTGRRHTLTLEHAGYNAKWEEQFILTEDGKDVTVDFSKIVKVIVQSTPSGEIVLDGKPTGKMTTNNIDMRVGQHTISVRKDGFILEGGEKIINLDNDLTKPLIFKLRKSESK